MERWGEDQRMGANNNSRRTYALWFGTWGGGRAFARAIPLLGWGPGEPRNQARIGHNKPEIMGQNQHPVLHRRHHPKIYDKLRCLTSHNVRFQIPRAT